MVIGHCSVDSPSMYMCIVVSFAYQDNTQTKPVRKAGTVSSSSKVPRIKRSSTTSVSKKAVLDDLPDIENFPSINSTGRPNVYYWVILLCS